MKIDLRVYFLREFIDFSGISRLPDETDYGSLGLSVEMRITNSQNVGIGRRAESEEFKVKDKILSSLPSALSSLPSLMSSGRFCLTQHLFPQ